MTLIHAPALPADHRRIVEGISGAAYDGAANDNQAPTGAAAQSWPAMRLNAGDGREAERQILVLLSYLFELAATPADNVPSPASAYGADGDLATADLMDEVAANDDGSPGDPGFGIDFRMRESTDLESLIKDGVFETVTTELQDGRSGGTRTSNFRIIHAWQTTLIGGKIVPTKFTSHAEYKTQHEWRKVNGKWCQFEGEWHVVGGEEFHAPRGPDVRADNAYKASPAAVVPSDNIGATHRKNALEERLDAMQRLERLREAIGDEAFEILRMAVVERMTARKIGEALGKKYNAASALGTTLIGKALQAANDNFPALAEAA